ncbi:hypothetical protein COCSADRAFT_99093 [Bipolaris sorokiniana ND90Pr]|uniref:Uncharacterized protein n=1 Tax=Cochliobolus sativus (strain ND90Pr / ATCC 201652) TaxID=665912 RepID=M2S032_COCSN|nr:uncharacterized protein COCSADRAFT_99093 [Bipolaris sorokiniana ND90Pr]EMD60618.1 hypothetical protein COCSADRAFT_99093 [Bipolaris sorokiniana ND90Pr]
MREELVDAAISTLKANGASPAPERIPIYPVVSCDSKQLACLRSTGLIDLTSTERDHELANDLVREWLNKNDLQFHAEADIQPNIVPDPLVSAQEPETPSTAVQLVRPGQGHDQPTPVQVPETANASMQKFRAMSSNNYQASLAATWGTASVDSNYDLDAYLERRRKGIEGRKDFFMDAEDDKSLQAVQELLLKWTTVDDPVVWENSSKQLRLLTQGP